jgi:hypothetical protein
VKYAAKWGREPRAEFQSVAELDALLDAIEPSPESGLPVNVSIYKLDGSDFPPTLQIGLGHPERSYVAFIDVEDDERSGWAFDRAVPPWREPIRFDLGGEPTDCPQERTRVTPDAARQAAREYVESGERPAGVEWQ